METKSNATPSPRTRAFVLLRKLDKNGSLTEAETHELVEIQADLPTDSVKSEINSFKGIVDARFETVDARFDSVDARFDSVDARFDSMEKRFDSMEKRFDSMEKRFDSVEKRFDSVIRLLKITITTGIGIVLTMGGWLIRSIITGGI